MELYKHNKKAYEKVMDWYSQGNNKAAIVHATGTGKSYIIAAVVEHFEKVLVIAPNNFVLNETRKVCKNGVEFRTYASVMYGKNLSKYDIIVLDEFHRAGAEKWGNGVQSLIDKNPNAKLLGTSATHIRYLDNERNMADELFEGNVVSYISLKEAIDNKILPEPIYVSSLYTLDNIKSRVAEISNNDENVMRELKGISSNWENAHGVPTIMRKYLNKDMKRIIVFCSKVSKASKAREYLGRWFSAAGFDRLRYYNIDYKAARLEQEMEDFQSDDYDGLKIAISVNMLNEGIHVPRVDCVVMLRSTVSRIIIEQQIGRCLTSENKNVTPVVIDLVNNMDLINYAGFSFEGKISSKEETRHSENNGFPFGVIDECRDIRIFLEQIEKLFKSEWTIESCMEEARKYSCRSMWKRKSHSSYVFAEKNGILEKCLEQMALQKAPAKWTLEKCIEDAKKYKTRTEWSRKSTGAYKAATINGWHKLIPLGSAQSVESNYWTLERCKEQASHYSTKIEWKTKQASSYTKAACSGWLEECTAHMTSIMHHYTYEELLESARKYKTLREWTHSEPKMATHARNKKIIGKIIKELGLKLNSRVTRFTKEECKKLANSCKSKSEFRKTYEYPYKLSYKNGWLAEFFQE